VGCIVASVQAFKEEHAKAAGPVLESASTIEKFVEFRSVV